MPGCSPIASWTEALGLTATAGAALSDLRRGRNTQHVLTGLLRQSIYSRLAGYEDVNDAERLAVDPAMRAIVDRRGLAGTAASTSQMGRFETAWLTHADNLTALRDLPGSLDRSGARAEAAEDDLLDMDSSESQTYGRQEGSAYNGHFDCTCYHPLFCFNQFGDLERGLLRNGNVASAEDWRSVLEPVVARYRAPRLRRYFRGDAAFAMPELYTFLEAEGYLYAIRLPANRRAAAGDRASADAPGRPPSEQAGGRIYAASSTRPKSWDKPRRVVAKVEWHQGELFPRVGFIVTNLCGRRSRWSVLQRSRHGRAVDQGGQERGEVDAAVVPRLHGQPGAAAAVRPGVQPGQLPADGWPCRRA